MSLLTARPFRRGRQREQTLQLGGQLPPTQPSALAVNGTTFRRCDPHTYCGPAQKRISFLSLVFERMAQPVTIPREITVSGRRFTRRCENYFLPLDASAADVESLFDYMAPSYEAVTDTGLNSIIARRLLREGVQHIMISDTTQPRMLDFGCGLGATWRALQDLSGSVPEYQGVELYGCDISKAMVDLSRQRGFIRACQSQYAHTAFGGEIFDVVIAMFVMHYFIDDAPLAEIARILKPEGLFIASLPSSEHGDVAHYRNRLASEPGFGDASVFEIETDAEQPRQIPVLHCRRVDRSPQPGQAEGAGAGQPGGSILV